MEKIIWPIGLSILMIICMIYDFKTFMETGDVLSIITFGMCTLALSLNLLTLSNYLLKLTRSTDSEKSTKTNNSREFFGF